MGSAVPRIERPMSYSPFRNAAPAWGRAHVGAAFANVQKSSVATNRRVATSVEHGVHDRLDLVDGHR
jgi:hypothetical protein